MASSFSLQVEKEMNCIERTFESSLMPEKGIMKTTPLALLDDLPMVNGNICGSGEEFFVDDLLDFSNGFDEEEQQQQQQQKQNRKDCSVSPNQKEETDNNSNPITRRDCSSAIDDLSYIPCTELSIPTEDMENLEWLSHFVEDSFSGYPLTLPAGKLPEKQKENISVPDTGFQAEPCFTTPIQTKVRTKRATIGWHVWSLGSPWPSAESSSTSSSSSSSSATSFSISPPPHPRLTYRSPGQAAESVVKMRPEKKNKRKSGTEGSGKGGAAQQRRCIHCGVHKTPQWRAGPLGAKTLCNACGVRYKSGRLLPEYRPACSPTFSSELHSNNHRKVLELRRKKESDEG